MYILQKSSIQYTTKYIPKKKGTWTLKHGAIAEDEMKNIQSNQTPEGPAPLEPNVYICFQQLPQGYNFQMYSGLKYMRLNQ